MTTVLTPAPQAPVAIPQPPPARVAWLALVRRGLLDNRRAPLVWGLPGGLMSALVVALYPSIRGSISQAVAGYPSGVKQAFGITDLGSVEAYLHAEVFSIFLPLAAAYVAMRCVAAAIAGAEERGQMDTMLAVPVARRTLVAAAFTVAAITVAAILAVAGVLTGAAAAVVGEPVSTGRLAGALAAVLALAVFFAGAAALAAGVLHRAGAVLGACAVLLGVMYLVDILGKLAGALAPLRWLSAFRLYGAPLQDGVDVAGLIALVVAGALLAAAGAVLYERRDITG